MSKFLGDFLILLNCHPGPELPRGPRRGSGGQDRERHRGQRGEDEGRSLDGGGARRRSHPGSSLRGQQTAVNVMDRAVRKSQVRQCLGFCTADFGSSLVYESAEQKPKHCLTSDFPSALVMDDSIFFLFSCFLPATKPSRSMDDKMAVGDGGFGSKFSPLYSGQSVAMFCYSYSVKVVLCWCAIYYCAARQEENCKNCK